MKHGNIEKTAEQIIAGIHALDLDPIKTKLMDAEEGEGWSRGHANAMEIAYKRFLTLLVKHPEITVAPSKEIDKFWHAHILDTIKYAEDCQEVFGYFLHHFPYFGLRGEEDAAQLAAAGQAMERLYAEEFGEEMPAAAASAYCMAAKPKADSAYCMAAKPKADAAYCMAAKPKADSAYCMAAKPKVDSAYCMAAKPKANAAYCMAAKPKANAAYCMAAKPKANAAYCMAAKPKANAAYCMAARPSLNVRSRLALAA